MAKCRWLKHGSVAPGPSVAPARSLSLSVGMSVLAWMQLATGSRFCQVRATGRRGSAADRGQQAVDLAHEVLEVKWFREHARSARQRMIGIERDRREAGDEHDFELGRELGRTPGPLNALAPRPQ